MTNRLIWKITGGDLLHRLNTAGLRKEEPLKNMTKPGFKGNSDYRMPDYLTFFSQLEKWISTLV